MESAQPQPLSTSECAPVNGKRVVTCPMRINIAGSPDDCHRSKKAWTRGLAWHPGSPFTSGDALTAGRADTLTPRQLTATRRSLPCALFLTPALAAARAAPDTTALLSGTQR